MQIPIVNKFVGRISDPNDPDKARLEAYDVNKFLADVDARIASKNLTEDAAKLKEAHLSVSTEKGDASIIMISPIFENISYEEFKQLCKRTWQPVEYKDHYFNLTQMLRLKQKGTNLNYVVEVGASMERVKQDIIGNRNIEVRDFDGYNEMVNLTEVLRYITLGTIYSEMDDDYRIAMKKVPINPAEHHIDMINKVEEKVRESKIRQEDEIALATQNKRYQANRGPSDRTGHNNKGPSDRSGQGNRNPNDHSGQGYRGQEAQNRYQGQYNRHQGPGNRQSKHYNQGRNNNNSGQYSKNATPQNYNSGYNRGGYNRTGGYRDNNFREQCKNCGRTNHRTAECKICDYCKIAGHVVSECRRKQRDWGNGNAQNRGNNQNKKE